MHALRRRWNRDGTFRETLLVRDAERIRSSLALFFSSEHSRCIVFFEARCDPRNIRGELKRAECGMFRKMHCFVYCVVYCVQAVESHQLIASTANLFTNIFLLFYCYSFLTLSAFPLYYTCHLFRRRFFYHIKNIFFVLMTLYLMPTILC